MEKVKAALVTQDIEPGDGQSSGDLVLVRIAHISDSASWTEVHHNSRFLGKGMLLEENYSRSWAGAAGPTEDASAWRKVC